ncbi:MAG TPA: 2-oxoglutarate dehydrogenase complex dihydrolipoyllysine-residue succinyltransferase [Verrucomicrobiae bacterium]|jgi:2-oxoglutarate dehydrogenase E2 component (dihydrolipoamide succinyltransferase)|nr:2-oxoglutarate dehydrogenase complex dihydrolipoyllysine-residue succinyltransferase [Verrucomicrobiae bacterium]
MEIELKVPAVGESITEVEIGQWLKNEGDRVSKDENVVALESEKTTLELPAPAAGVIGKILKRKGETAKIGDIIGTIQQDGAAGKTETQKQEFSPAPTEKFEKEPRVMPAAARIMSERGIKLEEVQGTGPGGRILKEDVLKYTEAKDKPAPSQAAAPSTPPASAPPLTSHLSPPPGPASPLHAPADITMEVPTAFRQEQVVPMTRLRRTLAERLVQAQHTAALLTTFNEVDMSQVMNLRKEYQESFTQKYGIKLGFMSFFVKACIDALHSIPAVNAEIRGTDILYRNYFDIGVAVGGGRGLVVPVLRNAERMSFAQIELAIADFAKRAKENKLKLEELQGGTFTISNGGIYGSLLSTPIINPPQSGILGMHAIQERPIALGGQVVIRPMMYIALTYDHRVVDGREAVTFLKRIKEVIENPTRILLEV